MAKDFAIVLNNGGINSAVATALAAQKLRPIMMYTEWGQTSSARQRAAYDQQVTHFKPYREQTITLPLVALPNPAQTSSADPRAVQPVAPRLIELLPLIGVAVQYANFYQAVAIYLGMRVGPDGNDLAQATEFFQIWNEMIQIPCRMAELGLVAPLRGVGGGGGGDVGDGVAAPF